MDTLPRPRTPVQATPASSPQLRWTLRETRPPRLVLTGEIDLATRHDFERAVARFADGHRRLIIDLTGIDFVGGCGINTLYAHHDSLAAVMVTQGTIAARALGAVAFPGLIVVPVGRQEDKQARGRLGAR